MTARIARTHQFEETGKWLEITTAHQTRWCENANAVAAAREETASLAKMFWTCLATVCSLMNNSSAISRLLFPAAISRKTWSSRPVSPCAAAPFVVAPTEAASEATRSGRARRPVPRKRLEPPPSPGWRCHNPPARGTPDQWMTGLGRLHKEHRAPSKWPPRAGTQSVHRSDALRRRRWCLVHMRPSRSMLRSRAGSRSRPARDRQRSLRSRLRQRA